MLTLKNLIFTLTLLAAIGCGLMAGVFFAFSTFVMKGISGLSAGDSIAAMQSINSSVANSLFGAAFILTPLICLVTMIAAIWQWQRPGMVYILIGGVIYLTGSLLVTIVFNIPLNDVLASVIPNAPNSSALWNNFFAPWMFWNHVRAVGSLVSTILFIIALCGYGERI